MRRALTARFGVVCLAWTLLTSGIAAAAEPKPVVHVVLAASGEPPRWFDELVRHLRSELGLRGIDVERGPSVEGGTSRDPDLIVEVPSPERPLLRFIARDRESKSGGDAPVRSIALSGVPLDGYALALAVAADELMRSNWPRAREHAVASDAPAADASAIVAPKVDVNRPAERDAVSSSAGDSHAWSTAALRIFVAAEMFTGGQTQIGPDARFAVFALPKLELELRGGFRTLLRHDTASGSVDGTALVGGGGVHWMLAQNDRAAAGLVGRVDLLRVHYVGTPRDGAVNGSDGTALGVVLAAGGSARLMLTRWLAMEGELLAGGSPKSTTATADFSPAFSTRGLAVLASAGLSVGF
jgi:hypothetical protein